MTYSDSRALDRRVRELEHDSTGANVPYAGEGFEVWDAGDMQEAIRAIAEEGRKHD